MTVRSLALTAVALAVAALAVPMAPGATAVTSTYSGIATRDLAGTQYDAPSALTWAEPATVITLSSSSASTLTVRAGTTASVTISADTGETLAAGRYWLGPGAIPDDSLTTVRLTAPDTETETRNGALVIHELVRAEDGGITTLSADLVGATFDQSNTGGIGPRELSLRYRSTRTYVGLRASGTVRFDAAVAYPSETRQFTITGVGPTPVTLGPAYAEAEAASDHMPFEVVSDGCHGKTLGSGATCTVAARAVAFEAGYTWGRIVVPDNTAGQRTVFRVAHSAHVSPDGRYHAVTPARLYDSRLAKAPIGPGGTRVVKVAGRGGVPDSIWATPILSVTAVGPTADGYVTVHPSPEYRPLTSNINFRRGQTRANLVAVATDPYDGSIRVYNASGSTHVLVDVVGWISGGVSLSDDVGSQLQPLGPSRVLDTRYDGGALTPGETADLLLDLGPDINPDVTAVAVNLTAVAPTQAGFITAWDGVAGRPNVSSLNFTTGATVPVLAFVPVSHLADGQLRLTLSNGSSGSTHVLADIVGYFDRASPEGLRLRHNGNPERVGDTRSGLNTVKSPIAPNSTRGFSGLSEGWRTVDTVGMLANVTAVRPTTRTYLTVWGNETGGARPTASNLNAAAGEVVANSVITGFSSTDRYSIYNQAGSTHVIVDAQLALDVYPGADSGLSTKVNPVSEQGSGRQMRSTVSRQ